MPPSFSVMTGALLGMIDTPLEKYIVKRMTSVLTSRPVVFAVSPLMLVTAMRVNVAGCTPTGGVMGWL